MRVGTKKRHKQLFKKIKNIFNKESKLYSSEDLTPREQCPCCDYISLPERNNYLICPICFWEDDGQNLDKIDESSGPNHGITLREGRKNFREFGACERAMIKNVISEKERESYEYKPRKDDL